MHIQEVGKAFGFLGHSTCDSSCLVLLLYALAEGSRVAEELVEFGQFGAAWTWQKAWHLQFSNAFWQMLASKDLYFFEGTLTTKYLQI